MGIRERIIMGKTESELACLGADELFALVQLGDLQVACAIEKGEFRKAIFLKRNYALLGGLYENQKALALNASFKVKGQRKFNAETAKIGFGTGLLFVRANSVATKTM